MDAAAEQTWARAAARAQDRGVRIGGALASMGRRARAWNVYADSLIRYPAHVVLPRAPTVATFREALRTAMLPGGARWCPLRAITALGPLMGLAGAPRCPEASAQAAAAACDNPCRCRSEMCISISLFIQLFNIYLLLQSCMFRAS